MLSKSFMRRLRKKQVLEEATAEDLTRALVASSDLLQSGTMKGMEDEVAIFGFTSLRRALDLHSSSKRDNSGRTLLTTKQVVDLVSSWSIVTDRNREDTVIEQLMEVCVEDGILKDCTLNQLASIIKAVQKLDINNRATFASAVGERFLTIIKEYDGAESLEEISPKLACNILRWPILSHRREKDVQKPFIDAALILLENSSFLSECSIADTSNFLWFLSSTRTFDEDVVINIGSNLLDPKVIEGSSANTASRILATFSSLISLPRNTPSQKLLQIQQDLFQSYGGYLLTSALTPAEISSSLHAYAKASYIHDMGIFDHLVGLLASSRRLCTCRQLSQSLWSCGRMAAWEDVDTQPNAPVPMEHASVPYLVDAKLVAEELACRVEDLTPTDIAQTVWALGRLEIGDHDIMAAFLRQATDHNFDFSSGQVTNILWGMAQTGQKDTVTITALSLRLTNEDVHLSPVEASSALFSLGRLDWCDEAVFASLSNTMMERIESANAQSVANALWAYKTVGLPAPQKLLNTWATEKLGLQNLKIFDD